MNRAITPPPRQRLDRLVLASHNPGKIAEFSALLAPFAITLLNAGQLALPEPAETGQSFADNAALKARAAAMATGLPALADDSGLAVSALHGAPGIYSARWAGAHQDFAQARARVLREMGAARDRSACFLCSLAIAWPDGALFSVEGRVDGTIVWPERGQNGFGYDAIFQPLGQELSFAEMTAAAKDAISHRARALQKLVDGLLLEPA